MGQVVLGGTLGIFLATALQLRGKRVAVVEQTAALVGREQEWNISRADMKVQQGQSSIGTMSLCPAAPIPHLHDVQGAEVNRNCMTDCVLC